MKIKLNGFYKFTLGLILTLIYITCTYIAAQTIVPPSTSTENPELKVVYKIQIDMYDSSTEKIDAQNLTSLLKMDNTKIPHRWKYIIGGTFNIPSDEENKFILRTTGSELRVSVLPEIDKTTNLIRIKFQTILDMHKEDIFYKYDGYPSIKPGDPYVVSGISIRGGTGQQIGTAPHLLIFNLTATQTYPTRIKEPASTPPSTISSSQQVSVTEKNKTDQINPAISLTTHKLDLALTCIYQKKFDLAVTICEEVLKTEVKNVVAWERLGSAYFYLGELDKAKTAWVYALNINPENKTLQQFIDRIDKLKSR